MCIRMYVYCKRLCCIHLCTCRVAHRFVPRPVYCFSRVLFVSGSACSFVEFFHFIRKVIFELCYKGYRYCSIVRCIADFVEILSPAHSAFSARIYSRAILPGHLAFGLLHHSFLSSLSSGPYFSAAVSSAFLDRSLAPSLVPLVTVLLLALNIPFSELEGSFCFFSGPFSARFLGSLVAQPPLPQLSSTVTFILVVLSTINSGLFLSPMCLRRTSPSLFHVSTP